MLYLLWKLSVVVLITHIGEVYGLKLNKPHICRVNYFNANIPKSIANDLVHKNYYRESNGTFEIMQLKGSERPTEYLCFLPNIHLGGTIEEGNESELLIDTDRRNAIIARGVKSINETFWKKECLFVYGLNGGYWTFGYCFGDRIIQFHEAIENFVSGDHRPEYPNHVYLLGKFLGTTSEKGFQNHAEWNKQYLKEEDFTYHKTALPNSHLQPSKSQSPFLMHSLKGGGICDLTRKPRSIDVLYVCDPTRLKAAEIIDVEEVRTCTYRMTISVPELCQIEELKPIDISERSVDIDCKLIDPNALDANGSIDISLEDFQSYKDLPVQRDSLFPLKKFTKITPTDYSLVPLGNGIFVGSTKSPIYDNDYLNYRHIMICSDYKESSDDLIKSLGSTLHHTVGTKLFSPLSINEQQDLLSWNDTFVIWFELYDFSGSLRSLAKIARPEKKERVLDIQIVDPETMLDQDGDLVLVSKYTNSRLSYNFESFVKNGVIRAVNKKDDEEITSSTPYSENENLLSNTLGVPKSSVTPTKKKEILEIVASRLGLENTDLLIDIFDDLHLDIDFNHI